MITESNKADFLNGYLICAAWAEELEDFDFTKKEKKKAKIECEEFINENQSLLIDYAHKMQTGEYSGFELAGHDFWLTRNWHGVGFWDRGLDELGEKLTTACEKYGQISVYKFRNKLYFDI